MPLKVKSVLKFLSIFVALPALMIGAVFLADKNGLFNIAKVDMVFKNFSVSPYYYAPLANRFDKKLTPFQGVSLFSVNIKEIFKIAEKESWIKTIQISKSWPSTLVVEIEPKSIKALYSDGSSRLIPIDEMGNMLASIESDAAPDVAILKGNIFNKKPKVREDVIKVLEQIPESGYFSKKTISEVRYSEKEGFWISIVKSGMSVRMGHDDISEKSKRVAKVLEYLEVKNIQGRVIDADFSKKVLVKLRKEP